MLFHENDKNLYPVFLISINLFAQNNKHTFAYVDELEEFSATTWILAGCEEFDRGIYKPYYSDIQKSLGKFKSHPVMAFLKKMRDIPGDVDVISYPNFNISSPKLPCNSTSSVFAHLLWVLQIFQFHRIGLMKIIPS